MENENDGCDGSQKCNNWSVLFGYTYTISPVILVVIGVILIVLEVVCGKRESFILIVATLMTLASLASELAWIFYYEYLIYTFCMYVNNVCFITAHWIFACRYWKVSMYMPYLSQ